MSKPAPDTRMEQLLNLAFKREVCRKVTDVIVPFNDAGSGQPFYYVHGILGVATEFRDMVRMLGPRQNCYGVQTPTDQRTSEFGSSIREMGKHYTNELIKFQPRGPFILGGYSMGATIALEIAQQLIASGREVSLLVVFDGELYNSGGEISPRNPLYWLKVARNLPRWTVDELIRNRRSLGRRRRMVENATHPVEQFINLKSLLPDHAAFVKSLYDEHGRYVPDSYPGRVLLFVSRSQPLIRLRQVEAAWTKIAKHSEVVEVNSRHIHLIRKPQGLPMAERLRSEIEKLSGRPDSAAPMRYPEEPRILATETLPWTAA